MNKITLNHLAERIAEATGQPIEQIRTFVTAFFVEASGQLEMGKSVKVKGIGTFDADGSFTPDESLADEVNSPFSFFEPVELEAEVTDEMLASVESERANASEEPAPEPAAEPEPLPEPPEEPIEESKADESVEQTIEQPAEPQIESEEMTEMIEEPAAESHQEESTAPTAEPAKSASIWGYLGFLALGMVIGMALMYFLLPWLNQLRPISDDVEAYPVEEIDSIVEVAVPVTSKNAGQVTDTVKPGVYFTTMARRHYGDKSFWVYIYEENIALLDSCHPEHVMPGTVVVIPPPEKYGIDASDIASIDSAKQKVIEIYRRFN